MGQYTSLPINNRTFTDLTKIVVPSDYGVVADGSTDDTAALNAMFAAIGGTTATVLWPNGFCKVTDTLHMGVNTGGGPQSHISILCVGSEVTSGIAWHGPTDRPALLICKNTNFRIIGLGVFNFSGSTGTSTGIGLGGNGSGGGNQTSNFVFERVAVLGFNIGVVAGINFGAASEGTFTNCSFANCDTGFITNDFNSLDFNFNMCSFGQNGIGLDTGVGDGINVWGGSSSNSSVADFKIGQNATICTIQDFRSEVAATMLLGVGGGGRVAMRGSAAVSPPSPFTSVTGAFNNLTLEKNFLEGSVTLSQFPNTLMMIENILTRWNTTQGLPFFGPLTENKIVTRALLKNNIDTSVFPELGIPDLDGNVGSRYAGGVTLNPFPEPLVTVVPVSHLSTPSIGVDYLALSHVRQLSEGTIPGATAGTALTPGQNLRVSATFATANSFAFLFTRTGITVNCSGLALITATVGTFLKTDVGKPIKITAGADTGADWYGYVTKWLSSTQVEVFPSSFASPGGRYPTQVGVATTVGADEPDTGYMVAGLCGNANETFWVDTIATTGFTFHSSNASSTATVTALIVR